MTVFHGEEKRKEKRLFTIVENEVTHGQGGGTGRGAQKKDQKENSTRGNISPRKGEG